MTEFTHAKLVEMAVAWLRRGVPHTFTHSDGQVSKWRHRCVPAFGELVSSATERPDAIGWHDGSSIVVECKRSRADFLADREKGHMRDEKWGMGRLRYYLVPYGLVTAAEVPAWCGLAYAHRRSIELVKEAPLREIHATAAVEECLVLASAVRRHVLKVPFVERTGRFETIDEARVRKGLPTIKQAMAKRRERGRTLADIFREEAAVAKEDPKE